MIKNKIENIESLKISEKNSEDLILRKFLNVFTAEECKKILQQRLKDSQIRGGQPGDLVIFEDENRNAWKSIFELISGKMKPILNEYYQGFFDLIPAEKISLSHIGFLHDHSGSFTEIHYDWEMVVIRSREKTVVKPFVVLIYLTSADEGGELYFPLQRKILQPELGSVVIFPCNYSYPHVSTPVTKGDKHVCRATYKTDLNSFEVDDVEI